MAKLLALRAPRTGLLRARRAAKAEPNCTKRRRRSSSGCKRTRNGQGLRRAELLPELPTRREPPASQQVLRRTPQPETSQELVATPRAPELPEQPELALELVELTQLPPLPVVRAAALSPRLGAVEVPVAAPRTRRRVPQVLPKRLLLRLLEPEALPARLATLPAAEQVRQPPTRSKLCSKMFRYPARQPRPRMLSTLSSRTRTGPQRKLPHSQAPTQAPAPVQAPMQAPAPAQAPMQAPVREMWRTTSWTTQPRLRRIPPHRIASAARSKPLSPRARWRRRSRAQLPRTRQRPEQRQRPKQQRQRPKQQRQRPNQQRQQPKQLTPDGPEHPQPRHSPRRSPQRKQRSQRP